jgi:DNA-binding CsgD family transcriptional regulator
MRSLPANTQSWLLLAAAEPDGDLEAITAAAEAMTLGDEASRPAELKALVRVNGMVEFRHPLIRSAIYNGAPSHDVRTAHEQLARVARRRGDDERWAIHRAAAAIGADEEVAAKLEAAAAQATRRGGFSSRANLLARAAALSATERSRHLRTLAAGEAAIAAGAGAQAAALLTAVDGRHLDDVDRGRLEIARSDLSILDPAEDSTFANRAQRLVAAARLVGHSDPHRAKQVIAYAYWALIQADDLVQGTTSREVAEEARRLCDRNPGADLLTTSLEAVTALVLDGAVASAPRVEAAIELASSPSTSDDELLQSYVCLAYSARKLRDLRAGDTVINRVEAIARNRGAAFVLCRILLLASYFDAQLGDLRGARRRGDRAADLMSFMGTPSVYARIVTTLPTLHGHSGGDPVPREETDRLVVEARRVGYGLSVASDHVGSMLLSMSRGQYGDAWSIGKRIRTDDVFFLGSLYLADLVECAARADDRAAAGAMLARLQAETDATNAPWAQGLFRRARAVLGDGDVERDFDAAIRLLAAADARADGARAHLLYGEWLRRQRRRADARAHLHDAFTHFADLGAEPWARRAERELAVLGEAPHVNVAPPSPALTPQEQSVASLAATGATNTEIAAQLFISANTVDYHLRKVFRKLGVSSRRQLRGLRLD